MFLSKAEVEQMRRIGHRSRYLEAEAERHRQRDRHRQSLRESVGGDIAVPDVSYGELRKRFLGSAGGDSQGGQSRRFLESVAEPAARQRIREQVASPELTAGRVDAEAGIIHGVRVLGRVSRNGRRYSDNAMEQAISLYDGQQVFIDHHLGERSVRDLVGVIERPRIEGTGEEMAVVADLRLIQSHPAFAQVLELAESFSSSFGLSHDAEGLTVDERGVTIVQSLDHVHSVDLVTSPATNRSLFEHATT